MKILVMAAHGNQGRVLLPKLRDAGFTIRALRATAGRDEEMKALGATEVIAGDACDRGLLRRAVDGVDAIYHIGPTAHPLEREIGCAMVDAAREARIGHFIYSSVLYPIASKMVQHKIKREVEEYLVESNINFTILQPSDYMVPAVFQPVFEHGVWEQLYDLDRVQSMIDIPDIADAAVIVARERERHFGATYQLSAPGAFSGHHIAEACGRITGRKVAARLVTPDAYFERYYGMGQGERFRHALALIRSVGMWYSQYNFVGNPNVLTWLLGRPPRTLDEFITREWRLFQCERGAAA